jgi:hypothetical protein
LIWYEKWCIESLKEVEVNKGKGVQEANVRERWCGFC